MLLCLAIPAWSLVGTVRGHPAVSMSLCFMCHCQEHSTESGFCRRAVGMRELAAELPVLPSTGVSAPPGALSFQGHLAWGINAARAGLCSSSASVSLYTQWQTLCSLQQYCRQTSGFVGGIWGLFTAKHSTNSLQLPPSFAASGFLPAELPSGRALIPTVDVQQLWDAVLPHTPLPPFPPQ